MDIFLLYQYIITGVLALLLINFILNNIQFKNTARVQLSPETIKENPLISVLVPARNEEDNIKRCLLSLMKQDYKNIEILVLNDNSTDNTAGIVSGLARKDKRITLHHGKPLEKGWLGKSFACYQLSKFAKGKYLVFTDADTLHFPNSIGSSVACLLKYKVDALSVFAKQIMVTIHERMMVPAGNYMIFWFLPLILIRKAKSALFCTAIGQFMLFKKEVYEKIGGHKAVKSRILEDVIISKQVKKCGYKFMIFDGRHSLYCRLYHNFSEVVKGYSKILFAAFGFNAYMMLTAILFVSAIFLLPFIMLPISILFDWAQIHINLMIIQVIMIFITRVIFTFRYRSKAIDAFLHPLAFIYLIAIAITSVFQVKYGAGIYWKGRTYAVSEEEELTLVNDNFKQ